MSQSPTFQACHMVSVEGFGLFAGSAFLKTILHGSQWKDSIESYVE